MTSPTPSPETAEAISDAKIERLEYWASLASPGPWRSGSYHPRVYAADNCGERSGAIFEALPRHYAGERRVNVEYAAAVSPDAVLGLIARLRRAEAEIAELKARVMPAPRRYETVTEIEALQDGTYWVALDRMRDTILPWNLFLRIGGDWVWHGDDINEGNADMIGAWIVGPLPLPTLPTEETDPNG